MNKRIKKWLFTITPLLFGFFFIIYAYNKFSAEEIQQIKTNLQSANYFYIVLSTVFGFVGSYLRSFRWKYTLEHLGYNVRFSNKFFAVNICYLMNMFIPRSGEISRALILKNYDNVPFDKGFGTIIAERIVDLVLLIIIIAVVFFLQFDIVKTFILDVIPSDKIIIVSVVGLFIFIVSIIVLRYSKLKIISLITEKLSGFKDGILSIFRMKKKWHFLFYTILIWISYVFMLWIAIFSFSQTSDLSLIAVLTTFVVGSIAITFTNNGLGSYPFMVSQILIFYGVSAPLGTAFGWVVWVVQSALIIVLGLISLFLLPIVNKKNHKIIQ